MPNYNSPRALAPRHQPTHGYRLDKRDEIAVNFGVVEPCSLLLHQFIILCLKI